MSIRKKGTTEIVVNNTTYRYAEQFGSNMIVIVHNQNSNSSKLIVLCCELAVGVEYTIENSYNHKNTKKLLLFGYGFPRSKELIRQVILRAKHYGWDPHVLHNDLRIEIEELSEGNLEIKVKQ